MDANEKRKFNEMEKNVATLLKVQSENGDKLDEILGALKGNELGERGLVKRLEDVEKTVGQLQTEKTKNSVYVAIIKWLCIAIGLLVIGYMFNVAFNKSAQINNNQTPLLPKTTGLIINKKPLIL